MANAVQIEDFKSKVLIFERMERSRLRDMAKDPTQKD